MEQEGTERQRERKSRDGDSEWGAGDGGIVDMRGRGRQGDKRCGSSILRVSSACWGCCSM